MSWQPYVWFCFCVLLTVVFPLSVPIRTAPDQPCLAPSQVDILINGKAVDELSFVCHREKAERQGRRVTEKLKSVINRQQFEVVIQAAFGNKVGRVRPALPCFEITQLTVAHRIKLTAVAVSSFSIV